MGGESDTVGADAAIGAAGGGVPVAAGTFGTGSSSTGATLRADFVSCTTVTVVVIVVVGELQTGILLYSFATALLGRDPTGNNF